MDRVKMVLDELMIMTAPANTSEELIKDTWYSGMAHRRKDSPFIATASLDEPVHRYGKKFKKYKLEFFLFVYTKDNDSKAIEATFEKTLKNLRRDDIVKTLEGYYHLDVFHGE